jgi:hypothetical protein
MSLVKISGNASGTGTLTLAAPNTNTDYTLTLPQATTTIVGTDATQTLTNKTIQGGAITSGTAVASTSGTSIDFTGIPSWVKRITVMFSGVSSSGTSQVQVQLGSGTVQTTGYRGSVETSATTVSAATITTGLALERTGGVSAANSRNGTATFVSIGSNIWSGVAQIGYESNQLSQSACAVTLSGTLDRVRITTVNGTDTFDAGTINILYEG